MPKSANKLAGSRSRSLKTASAARAARANRRSKLKEKSQNSLASPSNTASNERYKYRPLREEVYEIRLLTLLPGPPSSDIRVLLTTTPLTKDNIPKYEALSYAWGTAEDQVAIRVGKKSASLMVTQNLADALVALRLPTENRCLWIDAICVDQENLEERSRQLGRFGDIYQLANRVIVWLGLADETSGLAFSALNDIASRVTVDWIRAEMLPTSENNADWADRNSPLRFDEVTSRAIEVLLQRSWFERLWVQQEIRLANQSAIVTCGSYFISWTHFSDAIFCLFFKDKKFFTSDIMPRLELAFQMKSDKNNRLSTKVFAFLNIMRKHENSMNFRPNYTRPAGKIYEEFFLAYLAHTHDLNILATCELVGAARNIPSWVPDWSISSEARSLPVYSAAGNSVGNVQHIGHGILRASGIGCATINHMEETFPQGMKYHPLSVIAAIQRLCPRDLLENCSSYALGGSLLEAYCRTFIVDLFSENYIPPPTSYPPFKDCEDTIRYVLTCRSASNKDASQLSYEASSYLNCAFEYLRGRSFVKTDEGYIGIVPKSTKLRDRVCVLLGYSNPMVLRPIANGQFLVVGECYIEGLMYKSALLGPLPPHIQFVSRLNEEVGSYRNAYIDRESGDMSAHDPRLSPLPKGWKIKSHPKDHLEQIFEKGGGEGMKPIETYGDPRLTTEALRERGVPVVDFELV